MPATTQCPQCGLRSPILERLIGQSVTCFGCGDHFVAGLAPVVAPGGDGPTPLGPSPPVAPHRGTLILILGIASLLLFGVIGIFAWVLGSRDLARMRRGEMDRAGEANTKLGRFLGICGTVKIGVELVLVCVVTGLILAYLAYESGSSVSAGPRAAGRGAPALPVPPTVAK